MAWLLAWPARVTAAVLLTAGVAQAAPNNGQDVTKGWHEADSCARQAFQQFPDYTPESNAKREAARLECLRNHRLPTPDAAGSQP